MVRFPPVLPVALLAWTIASSVPAAAQPAPEPPPVVMERAERTALDLLAAARADQLDDAWIVARVDPGPSGWTRTRTEAWRHALRPGGPAVTVLQRAQGLLHVAPIDDGHVRVVLRSAPRLALRIDANGRIDELASTPCDTCGEPERWVRTLLADLRRQGPTSDRLRVAVDLDLSAYLAAHRTLIPQRWPALLDRRNREDEPLRHKLASARVLEADGDVVALRFADGTTDRWTVRFVDGEGRLVWSALPDRSPLQLSMSDAKRWRNTAWRRARRGPSWEPSWRPMPDGLGVEIGDHAVGAIVDPLDETVLIVALDPDRTLSAVFRVDPWTREVVDRIMLPDALTRRHLPVPGWTSGWPSALSPDARTLALATPDGLSLVDLQTGEIEDRGAVLGRIHTVAWTDDQRVILGLTDGRVRVDGVEKHLGDVPVLALRGTGPVVEAVLSDGRVVAWDGGDAVTERVRACPFGARQAAWRARDDSWIVACEGSTGVVVAPPLGAEVVPLSDGDPGRALVPGLPGLPPLLAVSPSPDGAWIAGLAPGGRVGWWSRDLLDARATAESP